VVIYQPTPHTKDFGKLPLYYLAKLEASYYADGSDCALCRKGEPLQTVWI
jgi:orotate phosphoribosyltransferase